MKYAMPMEDCILITVKRSKSKLEVKFEYRGRLFSETGSNNSAFSTQYIVV